MLESIFVVSLFLMYILLWKIKQVQQRSLTGIDPQVMQKSTTNVQRFMGQFTNVLTVYAAIIILIHAANIEWGSLFSRYETISFIGTDMVGFVIGLIGLSFCLYAQIKMGTSWRVGIDEKVKTQLITTGLYSLIRNPTYLGLVLLNLGVWLIWPTWTIFLLNVLFFMFLEIQVRCEEDYLFAIHGQHYSTYKNSTKRYLPYIY